MSTTRAEVEKELLKLPAQKRFREFNTHLAKTAAEWVAMEKQLLKQPKQVASCTCVQVALSPALCPSS